MLSNLGWIDGITASGVVFFGIFVGFFFFYKYKKLDARLLLYLGLANILAGLMFLGVFLDFVMVLLTGNNIDNSNGIVGILSYIFFAPTMITAIYIGCELILPKKKWYILSIFAVLGIIFEIIVLLDPIGSFNFIAPINPGEELIDYNVNLLTPAGILMAIFLLTVVVFLGFGFLYKCKQTTGVLRKKFLLLSMGSLCFCIFGLLEGLTVPGVALIVVRIGYSISFWLMYFGFIKK